jgi:hypothetical protein
LEKQGKLRKDSSLCKDHYPRRRGLPSRIHNDILQRIRENIESVFTDSRETVPSQSIRNGESPFTTCTHIAVLRKNETVPLIIDIKSSATTQKPLGDRKVTTVVFIKESIICQSLIRITSSTGDTSSLENCRSFGREYSNKVTEIIVDIIRIKNRSGSAFMKNQTGQNNLPELVLKFKRNTAIIVFNPGNKKFGGSIVPHTSQRQDGIIHRTVYRVIDTIKRIIIGFIDKITRFNTTGMNMPFFTGSIIAQEYSLVGKAHKDIYK